MDSQFTQPAAKYRSRELHDLINRLKAGDAAALRESVHFTLAESFGHWHNRARAKICRNLKHRPIDPALGDELLRVILERFASGRFHQQFKDQLRLAIRLDPRRALAVATDLQQHEKEYVRRAARWAIRAIRLRS